MSILRIKSKTTTLNNQLSTLKISKKIVTETLFRQPNDQCQSSTKINRI